MNAIGLGSPIAQDRDRPSCQKKKGGDPKGNRHRCIMVGSIAQHGRGRDTAIGEQQLRLYHAVRDRMGLGVERKLVAQTPGKDADPQQNQGRGQGAQPQPAAGQANPTSSCGIGRRNCQGRMVMMMPQSFDVFKTGSVSVVRNRFEGRDLQFRYAIR